MIKKIILTTSFEATHHWPECPFEDVSFLKNEHRHIFHVIMKFNIAHNDRDIEFIRKKQEVNKFIQNNYSNRFLGTTSCEDIAETLLGKFAACYVAVLEDNENGAEIYEN